MFLAFVRQVRGPRLRRYERAAKDKLGAPNTPGVR